MPAAMPAPQYHQNPQQQPQYQTQSHQMPPPQYHSQQPPPHQYPPSQTPPQHAPPQQYHPSQAPPQNGPPQYMYPPQQFLSPTVQCPSCASQFAPFAIQYDPRFTAWSTGSPQSIASPSMPPNMSMPPQYAPMPAQQRAPMQAPQAAPMPTQQAAPMPTQQPAHMQAQPPAPMPTQTIDFDNYVDKVRKLYDKYSSGSSSKEYDNAMDATGDIEQIVKMIRKQASKVAFEGKQDAMGAIVEIALEMLDEGGSTLSSEIRKGYDWSTVGDAIEDVLDLLSPEETDVLQKHGDLAGELRQLKEGAGQYGLDPDLDGAIERLSGKVSDGVKDEDDNA